jgi:hypothetical protein
VAGTSYDVLFTPVLSPAGWQPVWLGTVPADLWTRISGLTNTGPTMFFRAREHAGE